MDTVAPFIPGAQSERPLLFCLSLANEWSNRILNGTQNHVQECALLARVFL